MNKKVYRNINLTCVFQNTNPNFDNIGTTGSTKPRGTVGTTESSPKVISGMLSPTEGGVLFQETLPRRRDIRNARLYEGSHVSVVRRKDGFYYPLLKAFKSQEMQDKASLAFTIYSELSEALSSIE